MCRNESRLNVRPLANIVGGCQGDPELKRGEAGAESMPLREMLQTMLTDCPAGKEQPFACHTSASFIRQSAPEAVKAALGELGAGLLLEGSAGAGNWAGVPWISVFDPAITTTATQGRRDAE